MPAHYVFNPLIYTTMVFATLFLLGVLFIVYGRWQEKKKKEAES